VSLELVLGLRSNFVVCAGRLVGVGLVSSVIATSVVIS